MSSKLRWRCRRGTRELDVVLGCFLDRSFSRLSSEERARFEALLDEQDPDLVGWLWGGLAPPPEWEPLIRRIRSDSGIDPPG